MISLLIFLFGTVVGSFLNVVIYRLPKGESIIFPPSHCPHCRHRLFWYDLMPIISYILLFGKCRYCKKTISVIYPLVEAITGLLFLFIFIFVPYGNIFTLFYYLFMAGVFLAIFFTDLKYGLIPFQLVLIGTVVVLFKLLLTFSLYVFLSHILSALAAFLIFLFLFLVTKGRGMGFGDVILVMLMGLFLGYPAIGFALYIAFLTGAVASLILIIVGSKRLRNDTIPFGPFLVLGTFINLFFIDLIQSIVRSFIPL